MKFAVIKTGGKQYKVQKGDKIKVEKLDGNENAKIVFGDILLIADDGDKTVKLGAPFIKDAKIEGRVLKQARAKKVIVFKYKPKKRYKKKAGHRQPFTEVEIQSIPDF